MTVRAWLRRRLWSTVPPTDYELRRVVENMDTVRRNRRNTNAQRNEADAIMLQAEGALYDRRERPA